MALFPGTPFLCVLVSLVCVWLRGHHAFLATRPAFAGAAPPSRSTFPFFLT